MLKEVFGRAKQLLSNFKDVDSFCTEPFSYKRPLKLTEVNHSSKFFTDKILMLIDTLENYIPTSFTEDNILSTKKSLGDKAL